MMTVVLNPLAVAEEIRHSIEWRHHADNIAQRGLAYAQSIAPVDTGEYRDSLTAELGAGTDTNNVPGAPAVHIGNFCDHTMEVEFQEPMRYLTLLSTLDYLAQGD